MDANLDEFKVAVIATMRSGKSTTLNALLGAPVLPAKNEACTAVLTRIENVDGIDGFRARRTSSDGAVSHWQLLFNLNRSTFGFKKPSSLTSDFI